MNDQTLSYLQEKLAKAEAIKEEIYRMDLFLSEDEDYNELSGISIDFRMKRKLFTVYFDKRNSPIDFSFEEFIGKQIFDGAAEYRRQLQIEYEKL